MILKSPSIRIRMTSQDLWCLEGTPGILEVYNVIDCQPEDQEDDSNTKRAEIATKLLETLEKFNYDETEPTDNYFADYLSAEETSIELPIFEDYATPTPTSAPLAATGAQGPGGFYNARCSGVAPLKVECIEDQTALWNKKVGYEWSAGPSLYESTPQYSQINEATPQYQGVPNELTPPCSPPNMYESPRRGMAVEYPGLGDDMLKPAADINMKEDVNTALLSLLSEMNPKDIDEFVVRSAEENFGIRESEGYSASPEIYTPELSPQHSCSSDSFGYHSESDHSSSDPDYSPFSPEVSRKFPKSSDLPRSSTSGGAVKSKPSRTGATRGAKPYSRKPAVPIEDKKLRKKEQNKNAATRYRIKKKAEIEVILGEENELKEKNEELVAKVEDLNREITFVKKLMRDFFKNKGLLK